MEKDLLYYLQAQGVEAGILAQIEAAPFTPSPDPGQHYANRIAAQLRACRGRVSDGMLFAAMGQRACCKGGSRLQASRAIAAQEGSLEEKLKLLAQAPYMGRASLTPQGELLIQAVGGPGDFERACPCWHLKGKTPGDGPMPRGYCACCGGHFAFHYGKALGKELTLIQVVSSILASQGKEPCVFLYRLEEKRRGREPNKKE